jgi:hypothetical protein
VRIADLDTKFLRNEAAVKRAEFSKFMFDAYTNELEALGRDTGKKRDYFDKDLVTGVRDGVHKKLLDGMCAYNIVVSELNRLLETDISVPCETSCNDEKHICGCFAGTAAYLNVYLKGDVSLLNQYTENFMKQYKSNVCGILRPAGIRENDPVHICAALILDTALFAYRFLTAEI